ncbi:MAG: histidinol dehydrogenase [Dethiobacteria bacterium]|nr:histidinol dehydrogenase [Dethiobacteria bacterium]
MKWLKKPTVTAGESFQSQKEIKEVVQNILQQVKEGGDRAILELTEKYDQVRLDHIQINHMEVKAAYDKVDRQTIDAVEKAADNIRSFAIQQLATIRPLEFEKIPGVKLGHKLIPLNSVGCYVPAGRYPLPSSALMSAIPAKVAGVKRVMACAPPSRGFNTIHPLVLIAMDIAGVDELYCMGGAQAIAAYKFGTKTINPSDMIVGPGNKYVVEAKRQLCGEIGIDLLAGPSEVLIIADHKADIMMTAMDLLAKCEHDPDAISILVSTNEDFAARVIETLEREMANLKTRAVAAESWEKHGEVIIVDSYEEAVCVANDKAPEHLQLLTEENEKLIEDLVNYGSLFIGEYSPVAFGDYCSGTNHTLPTSQCARFSNGLWVGSFIRVASYQKISREGAKVLAEICSAMAEKEGLFAHKTSSDLRK